MYEPNDPICFLPSTALAELPTKGKWQILKLFKMPFSQIFNNQWWCCGSLFQSLWLPGEPVPRFHEQCCPAWEVETMMSLPINTAMLSTISWSAYFFVVDTSSKYCLLFSSFCTGVWCNLNQSMGAQLIINCDKVGSSNPQILNCVDILDAMSCLISVSSSKGRNRLIKAIIFRC